MDTLAADLDAFGHLSHAGDPRARGAALEAAYAALRLAVTSVPTPDGRARRHAALRDATLLLEGAALGHVAALLAAALTFDVDPAALSRGTGGLQ